MDLQTLNILLIAGGPFAVVGALWLYAVRTVSDQGTVDVASAVEPEIEEVAQSWR